MILALNQRRNMQIDTNEANAVGLKTGDKGSNHKMNLPNISDAAFNLKESCQTLPITVPDSFFKRYENKAFLRFVHEIILWSFGFLVIRLVFVVFKRGVYTFF